MKKICFSNIILFTLFIIVVSLLLILLFRNKVKYRNSSRLNDDLETENEKLSKELKRSKKQIDLLQKIKNADENIFDFIRCINIPQVKTCREIDNGQVCRSRQINCNHLKLLLEDDPIAKLRMKRMTTIA